MPFASATALAPVTVLGTVGSTFDAVDADAPHLSTWVTLDQRAGRGRLGRAWVAPAGRCLAASIVVRPTSSPASLGWLPLAAGLALAEAVAPLVDAAVGVKWPNDVQLDGAKVAGILCERRRDAVVVGMGVNLTLTADELPTTTSTSLAIGGAQGDASELADRVLTGVLAGLDAARDLEASGLQDRIRARCSTLGTAVRVTLPGDGTLEGVAVGLGPGGELEVEVDGVRHRVAAGDVNQVRGLGG